MDCLSASGESTGSQVGAGAESATTRTMWGVPLRGIPSGEAHYEEFGEAPMKDCETAADVDAYAYWPDPDRFDYEKADRAARRAVQEYAVIGPWVSFFEIYCQLRGLEQAMMDLALDPDLVNCILDRVEAVQTEMMRTRKAVSPGLLSLCPARIFPGRRCRRLGRVVEGARRVPPLSDLSIVE